MRSAVVCVWVVAVLGGCYTKSPPAAPRGGPPALFASIPADTAFVVASFEPVPQDLLATYRDIMGPPMRAMLATASRQTTADRLVFALAEELEGKWTAAGIESLGFSAKPIFVLYGLGLLPVLRLEIRSGDTVLSTLQRIVGRARLPLPPPQTRDGRRYWRIPAGERDMIIVIAPTELVVAFGPGPQIDSALPLILGTQRPPRSMADGAMLAATRAKHRLGTQAIAIVDTRRLLDELVAGVAVPPACRAEIERAAERVPRVIAGVGFERRRHTTDFIVELAPALVADLRTVRAELPGLTKALADQPLFLLAAAIDLPRAQQLGSAASRSLHHSAEACGALDEAASFAKLADTLAQPLPAPIAQTRGALFSLLSIGFETGPVPSAIELAVLGSSADARGLFTMVGELVASIVPLQMPLDGKLHTVQVTGLPPSLRYIMFAGAGERTLGFAVGAQGKQLAEQLMTASPVKAPLAIFDADYGQISELQARIGKAEDRLSAAVTAELFGRTRMTFDITDHGLELRATFETK